MIGEYDHLESALDRIHVLTADNNRLRAQVAALLRVKEAAESVDHWAIVITSNTRHAGCPYHKQVATALVGLQNALREKERPDGP